MPFKKGNTEGKGRPKGSNNKLDAEARELFIATLGKHSSKIDTAFEKVYKDNPLKFLEMFAKYAQYFVPKKTEAIDKISHSMDDFSIKDLIKFDKSE